MQTMAPPEDATAERFARVDERFDRVDERFDETNHCLEQVDQRITEKSSETNLRLSRVEETNIELKRQMVTLNTTFQRGNYALIAAVMGAILAILAKGG
jgi:hypothetical protein